MTKKVKHLHRLRESSQQEMRTVLHDTHSTAEARKLVVQKYRQAKSRLKMVWSKRTLQTCAGSGTTSPEEEGRFDEDYKHEQEAKHFKA